MSGVGRGEGKTAHLLEKAATKLFSPLGIPVDLAGIFSPKRALAPSLENLQDSRYVTVAAQP